MGEESVFTPVVTTGAPPWPCGSFLPPRSCILSPSLSKDCSESASSSVPKGHKNNHRYWPRRQYHTIVQWKICSHQRMSIAAGNSDYVR